MRRYSLWLWFAVAAHGAEITGVVRCNTQAVANAVVYLNVAAVPAGTNAPVVLRQWRGEWNPRIQVARSGGGLVLKNDDPTLHVAHVDLLSGTNAPRRLLTEAMPFAGYEKSFSLESSREAVLLRATTGNGEGAVGYAAVLPHPWAAVTGADGRFALRGVPAGQYKLFVWDETRGTISQPVNTTAGRSVELTIELKPVDSKRAD